MKTFLLLLIAAFGYVQSDWSKCEVCAFILTGLREAYGDDAPSSLGPEALDNMICDTLAEDTSDKSSINLCYNLLKQVRRRGLMNEIMKLSPKYDSRTDKFCARKFDRAYCKA
ncbi:hypothetical protein Y032_0416g1080 [Ancylostoma ceylanicum]|uniref:Saposin B-type domain-containing protein n=1 Tax=Ancylostoma ceylanicum TaxID=53326 RepID=A0A016X142_9BILA|nr:hypothetical protein Y032_0416g1080 [Ancylostoma ceylanicum]